MIKINLLDYRKMKRVMQLQKELGICLILIIVALGFIGLFMQMQGNKIKEAKNDIKHWEVKLKTIDKTVKKVDEAKAKKERIEHILKSIKILKAQQSHPAQLLDNININLPGEVWLSSVQETEPMILLEGFSFSDPAIASFMKNLEKLTQYFTSIELIETRQVKMPSGKVRQFKIQCSKKPKGSPPIKAGKA